MASLQKLLHIAAWVAAVGCLIVGALGIANLSVLYGVLILAIGIVLLPPAWTHIQQYSPVMLKWWVRAGIVVALVMLSGTVVPEEKVQQMQEQAEQQRIARENMRERREEERNRRTYAWLDMCSRACENALTKIRIDLVNGYDDCEQLSTLYDTERVEMHLEWRFALNDKAASLDCPGFPKELAVIQKDAVEDNSPQKKLDQYKETLAGIGFDSSIISTFLIEGEDPDTMIVTVSSGWHYQPYRVRLQLAQTLWQTWAGIHSPFDQDKALLSLKDALGNTIGGSRLYGSSIWVEKE